MLVLTRAIGDRIIVTCPDGSRLVVQVCDVNGPSVRLGVTAPPNYLILREELEAGGIGRRELDAARRRAEGRA